MKEILYNFLVQMLLYFKDFFIFFAHENIKKTSWKVAYLITYGSLDFFFSAAPTAQNSLEL